MAQIFPPWANRLPYYLLLGASAPPLVAIVTVWYFFSPQFTDVGYQPRQPVAFSHTLHAGELNVDCRYCHAAVEVAAGASIPPTATCMKCHSLVARRSDALVAVLDSLESGEPIRWIRVHKLPDYAYFDHGAHVRVGVGCASCHGDVTRMEEVRQVKPLSMSWCLDCHRNPGPSLVPLDQVTRVEPDRSSLGGAIGSSTTRAVAPPTDCSGCHR